jgi:hypothetical protein
MRDWPGLNLSKRPIGDGFTVLENVSPAMEGEVNRRRGLGTRTALTYTVQRVSPHTIPSYVVVAKTGTSTTGQVQLGEIDTTTGTNTWQAALPELAQGGTLAGVNDAVYWADGQNDMRVFYTGPNNLRTAGIAAPASAPAASLAAGGAVTAGTHLIRYRYYDSTRSRYSDPSPAVSMEVAGQSTATGALTVDDTGAITQPGILISGGDGYAPGGHACSLSGGSGTGAAVTAYNQSAVYGPITSISVYPRGSGYTSAPTLTIPAPSGLEATIDVPVVASSSYGVDYIIIEMTLSEGSEFYQAAKVSNTTTTRSITMDDDTLSVQVAAADYTEDGYGHGLPPKGTIIAAHRSRMFCWGATDEATDTLYWSRAGFVESWKPAEWSRRVFGAAPDSPRAIFSLSDDLYLVGARSMARLIFTVDPGTGFIVQLPTTSGAWNQQSVVTAEGAVFGFGYTGAWVVQSLQPREISQPVRPFLEENLDTARGNECFAWWDPVVRCVTFAFPCLDGAWRGIVWHLDEQLWTTASWKQTISAATVYPWDDGDVSPLVAGETCYYRVGNGMRDGGGTSADGSLVSYVGTTVTTTDPHGMPVGAWMYFPRTDQWGEVTAVLSASTVTIAGLTGLSNGDEIQYGPIPWRIVSEWVARENFERGKAAYLRLEGAPIEDQAVLQVRFFSDWGTTAIPYIGESGTTPPSGVTYDASLSRFLVDLSACGGMTRVPFPSDNYRVIRYEISVYASSGGIHLIDAEFEPKAKRGAE